MNDPVIVSNVIGLQSLERLSPAAFEEQLINENATLMNNQERLRYSFEPQRTAQSLLTSHAQVYMFF